jgi:hypothetical protein
MRKGMPVALAGLLLLALAPGASARSAATACDAFASRACLMPFPNDMNLTVRDKKSPTGLRVHLPAKAMPANKSGKRITTGEYNRQDGFSPGQTIVVNVKGLHTQKAFNRSKLVPLDDLGRSFAKRAGIVVINAKTRKRQLIYAELDANAKSASQRMLLIHPGKNFNEGARYIVALRGLRTASGKKIKPSKGFAALKRGKGAKRLRKRYKGIFKTLKRAGIKKGNLTLAWDFTIASERGLTARMLKIRNDAFAQLGDNNLADGKVEGSAPKYTVTKVVDNPDAQILRRISGTFTVPCYLNAQGCPPGARFHYSSKKKDALPTQLPGNTQTATFECAIPRAALTSPAHAALYGHGLLGGPEEIDGTGVKAMSQEHDFAFCATALERHVGRGRPECGEAARQPGRLLLARRPQPAGLPQPDVPGEAPHPPERLDRRPGLQGPRRPVGAVLRRQQPGRHPRHRADRDGARLHASGARRARINFSVLLTRSSNWDTYGQVFNPAYPKQADRPLILSLINLLWDRGEGDGWAHHVHHRSTRGHAGPPRADASSRSCDFQVTTYQGRRGGAHDRRPHPPAGVPPEPLARARGRRSGSRRSSSTRFAGSGARVLGQRAGARGRHDRQRAEPLENTPPARGQWTRTARRATPPPRATRSHSSCSPATWSTCAAGRRARPTTRGPSPR